MQVRYQTFPVNVFWGKHEGLQIQSCLNLWPFFSMKPLYKAHILISKKEMFCCVLRLTSLMELHSAMHWKSAFPEYVRQKSISESTALRPDGSLGLAMD